MISASRRWVRRNRRGLAIGAGVVGAGYLAGQYVITKISEARERMSSDRIAREKCAPFPTFIQYQSTMLRTIQSSSPIRTEPNRLHLHHPRFAPHSRRGNPRSPPRRRPDQGTAEETRGETRPAKSGGIGKFRDELVGAECCGRFESSERGVRACESDGGVGDGDGRGCAAGEAE